MKRKLSLQGQTPHLDQIGFRLAYKSKSEPDSSWKCFPSESRENFSFKVRRQYPFLSEKTLEIKETEMKRSNSLGTQVNNELNGLNGHQIENTSQTDEPNRMNRLNPDAPNRPQPDDPNRSNRADIRSRDLITSSVLASSSEAQPQADERHQSKILFIIVAVFLLCSLPRAILNLVEFEHMFSLYYLAYFVADTEDIVLRVQASQTEEEIACFYPPFWFVLFTNVSSLFMTVNASLGFLIYCFGCSQFRAELSERMKRFKNYLRTKNIRCFNILQSSSEEILV
jgi:hypothetical protein